MEPKDLSKCKYIYRVYVAKDGITHMEKYPVIYANREFIYFKDGRSRSLNAVCTRKVLIKDPVYNDFKINEAMSDYRYYGHRMPPNLYIWDENGIDMSTVDYVYNQIKKVFDKDKIDKQTARVNSLKEQYERQQKELERLTKELEG